MQRVQAFVCCLCCVLFFSCGSALASELAELTGYVSDPTGARVSRCRVQATNVETNVSYYGDTNEIGLYRIPSLPVGNYRVIVQKQGFKTVVKQSIELHVQDVLALNVELELGAVSESISVQGGAELINAESPAVSTIVDRNFVANIPLNGRSFQDLISMTPGVVTQNPNSATLGAATGGDFSVNGQRTEANSYTVDGVSANVAAGTGSGGFVGQVAASGSIPAGTILGTTQSLVSVDALQEFRVQSSTYSAEYGRAPGGQFSLATRSGTSAFHGSLFDYLRNNFFDANDWFNDHLGKPITALRQNDFGGTLGGPVVIPGLYNGKDKTFFFFSYEGLRLVQPQAASTSQLVPDMFMRQQAASALQPILNAYPVPNGKDFGTAAAPSLAQFIQPFSLPSQIDSSSIRLDHTFGAKLSLFFRFADTPTSAQTRGPGLFSDAALNTTSFNTQTYTLGATSQLSSRTNNDFRLGYARSDAQVRGVLTAFGGASPINLAAAMGAGPSLGPQSEMLISVPGAGSSVLDVNSGNSSRLRQWNVIDTLTVSLGRHQLKTGADYRRILSPGDPPTPEILAVFGGATSVLSNKPAEIAVIKTSGASPIFSELSAFVQDEWHVATRLNLSLGLRWEVDPPPSGANDTDAYTLLGSVNNPSSLSLAPRGTSLWHTTWYNFAPRLGAAWIARNKSGWETVIRGGGGVFFDTNDQTAAQGFSGLGFSATGQYFGASLPVTPTQLNVIPSVAPPFSSNVYLFPSHLQLPYTLQWNVGIQQALGAKQALTVTYVGAAGRRLTGQQQLSLTKFNPIFGSGRVIYWTSNLTSDYDALEVQFQRSVSQGIHALASYTWSHCIDVGSSYSSLSTAPGINQTAFLRGNCDMDVRQNVEGGASWDLPSVNGSQLVRQLANHWGLDSRLLARTGFPVPLCGAEPSDPITGSLYCAGLNLVSDQPLYLYGSQYPGGRTINPAAFIAPSGGTLGDAPRNFVRGFPAWQINAALRREFPMTERLRLQFRAEAFNIFNHPNFGRIDSTLTDATFGQALAMLNQGLATVAPQYQQGGPRSMQFALKLLF